MAVIKNDSHLPDACVDRIVKDTVRISWKTRFKDLEVSIYHGDSPETIRHDELIHRTKGQTAVKISGLNPDVPHYFEITAGDGNGRVISERRLPLEGAVNFRDLGGYETLSGKRLKWGRVFRSDHLAGLTDRDLRFLKHMRISSVCDFRTAAEARRRPDRFPGDGPAEYIHLPIDHLRFDPTTIFQKLKSGDTSWLTRDFLIDGYILNIEKSAPIWGEIFERLADQKQLPLVFHCTGGKDRTGTCAALILLSLGVSEKTVIDDHGLSNIYIRDVVNGIYAKFESAGIARQKIAPYFSAPRYCIEAMLKHLRQKYGSAVDYLKAKGGVTEKVLKRIRAHLLE